MSSSSALPAPSYRVCTADACGLLGPSRPGVAFRARARAVHLAVGLFTLGLLLPPARHFATFRSSPALLPSPLGSFRASVITGCSSVFSRCVLRVPAVSGSPPPPLFPGGLLWLPFILIQSYLGEVLPAKAFTL